MPLSTSSLFHFTNKKSTIEEILKQTFKVFYSFEKIEIGDIVHEAAYPMVSFCDIPLSEIKSHVKSYGHYGIGLYKKWGNSPISAVLRMAVIINTLWRNKGGNKRA